MIANDHSFEGDVSSATSQRKNTSSVCGKPLSRYNKTGLCFSHPKPNRFQIIREWRERQEKAALTAEATRKELRELTANEPKEKAEKNVSADAVARAVCAFFLVSEENLNRQGRQLDLVRARHVLMYLLYADTSLSYPDIGKRLGGRDHTTILHGVQKVTEELESDFELQDIVQNIRAQY